MADTPSLDLREPVVQLRGVIKNYQGLRPLRIKQLDLARGQALSLVGFDEATAEVFVNLLTAGTLPDEGEVIVFGTPTATIRDHRSWMAMLDRFGLVSGRSVLLDQLTAEQNLAIPFSLTVESMSDDVRSRVRALADEIGLPSAHLALRLTALPPASTMRVRLGRALALGPDVVLAEHPNAPLSQAEALAFASDLARIRIERRIASIVLTADRRFAQAAGTEVLTLQPATGELKRETSWTRWFR